MSVSFLSQPLFDIGGHHITALGVIGFAAWFIAGVVAVRMLQSDLVRRLLR